MKKIYIVLTHTGTILSKIIKKYTKDEFSHISISLDEELQKMYSFGRLHPYNAFLGGFVHEYVNRGTFKRFCNTRTKIYSLVITDEQYQSIENTIKKISEDKASYKFNVVGLFAIGFHKRVKKEHSFYCAEFVKYVLEEAKIDMELPEPIKPDDFKKIEGLKEVYVGLLRKYRVPKIRIPKILKTQWTV